MNIGERLFGARGTIFNRLAVGLIFLTQGILKYIDSHMGVDRFMRIRFPYPAFSAHVVGVFEIVCALFVLAGVFTRLAAIPLLVIISTAIATTKVPELSRPGQGFWYMVSDARADFAMLMCLLFSDRFGPAQLTQISQPRTKRHCAVIRVLFAYRYPVVVHL